MISWGQNAPIKMPCKVPSFHFVNRPGVTEPALVLRSPQKPAHSAPSTGTVPPAPVTDSPALQPLHSIAFRLQRFRLHSTAFRRPQTGETVKTHRARPKEQGHQRPRDYVRPDRISPRDYVRARRQRYGREAAPGQKPAIAVSTASFRCAALVFHSADSVPDRSTPRNRPDSLMGAIRQDG
jgi:hypothetical protein